MPGPDGRFLGGEPSPNPNGRPPKYPPEDVALLAMLSEVVSIKQNGVERELTTREAMLLQTVQKVLKPKPGARAIRMVIDALIEREVARHSRMPSRPRKEKSLLIRERDSDNAFDAMCLLGIAEPDPTYNDTTPRHDDDGEDLGYNRIKLLPWAIAAAQDRGPVGSSDPNWSITLNRHTAGHRDWSPYDKR